MVELMLKNRWLVIIPIVVFIDQLLKWVVRFTNPDIELISGFFSFTFIKNTGAGFGILKDYLPLLIVINIVALIILVFVYINDKKTFLADISFILIISGAVGNLIDRVFFGYVIDFIYFHFFPAFNIADMAVSIGAVLLGYCILFKKYDA